MIDDTLYRFKVEGDKYKMQHVQDVSSVAESCHTERKEDHNGFSAQRSMRKVGSIPLIYTMQPEYKDLIDGDQAAMSKASERFFRDHPEFMTCNGNT